jgi:hypothetical protein
MTDISPPWPTLLGQKVSIRYRLHDDPRHPFSEAIGVVMSVEGSESTERVTIMTRKGTEVVIAAEDVLARKTFR